MRQRWTRGTALIIILMGLMATAAPATATSEQRDQFQHQWAGEGWGINADQSAAQIFTPGFSGVLTSVRGVIWRSDAPDMTNLSVEIRSVDPTTGAPADEVLSSALVPPTDVPAGFPAFTWLTITFSSPAAVVAGQQYAMVASSQGGDLGSASYTWGFDGQMNGILNPYEGGDSWVYGSFFPGWFRQFDTDLTFETYVLPADATNPTPPLDPAQRDQGQGQVALGFGVGNQESVAQTFTAGASGWLTEVRGLLWRGDAPTDAELTVELRAVDPQTGAPSTQVLSTVTVSVSDIPTAYPPTNWTPFVFERPAPVEAGQQYAFVVRSGASPSVFLSWGYDGLFEGHADPYLNGDSYVLVPFGEGAWWWNPETDLAFETYVATPQETPLDDTAPVIMPTVDGIMGAAGWYRSNVVVAWSVEDAESSIQTSAGCDPVTIADDTDATGVTLTCSATSAGGTSTQSVTVQRDTIDPTIATTSVDGVLGNNGWYTSDVAVTYHAEDPLSGLADPAQALVTRTTTGEGSAVSVASGEIRDVAGNVNAGLTTTFKIDSTAPQLSVPADIDASANSDSGAVVTYGGVSAYDALSGAATPTCDHVSGALFPLGTTTVTCSTSDGAGNVSTRSFMVTVSYDWLGVLQPINADGSSRFKAGSTVPVKFQLTGASSDIANASATLSYVYLGAASGSVNEAVSTSAASTGNHFRYDAASGQYICNWSTKDLAAGAYQLVIDLGDGQSRTAIVALR